MSRKKSTKIILIHRPKPRGRVFILYIWPKPRGRVFILYILKAPQDLGDILTFILSTENSNLKKKAVLPGTMNNSSYLNNVSFHHIKYKIFSNYQNSISQIF